MHALLPGEQVDREPGHQTADEGPEGDSGRAAGEQHDHDERPGRRPLREAEHVRTAQRIARDGLEQRTPEPERGADQKADEDAGQPQFPDDELLSRVSAAEQRLEDVTGRDREVPGADQHDTRRERADQEKDDDRDGAGVEAQREAAGPYGSGTESLSGCGLHSWAVLRRRTR